MAARERAGPGTTAATSTRRPGPSAYRSMLVNGGRVEQGGRVGPAPSLILIAINVMFLICLIMFIM